MTNAHHDPPSSFSSTATGSEAPQVSSQEKSGYEGFDPDLPEGKETAKFLGLSSVQIGASALAAVTSALAASFFGVGGTLIGAAVGSIVSTVAGAMYAESMRRAGGRLQTVMIQRVPVGSETRPTQVPRPETMTQIIPADADQTIVLPVEGAGEHTAVGASGRDLAETSIINTTDLGAALTGKDGGQSAQPSRVKSQRPWWRRPVFALSIVGLSGFIIALIVITGIEGLTGHTFSGGSGTSISKLGGTGSGTKSTPAETVTVTSTESSEPEPTVTSATTDGEQTPEPSATDEPAVSETTTPEATATSKPVSTSALDSAANAQSTAVAPN
jgi:hypothetical protein